MSNVMSLKSFQNNVKRNGFDLSFKNAFTAKAGELLPVMVKEVIPGDKFKISAQSFTRTQPLNTAAYVRMREYYDVFFVPYRLLWNRFPTFFTNLPDFHHASGISSGGSVGDQHPYFTSLDIYNYIKRLSQLPSDGESSWQKYNFFGFERESLTIKLLDYLGYGLFKSTVGPDFGTVMNPLPLLAYQKIYQDFFRDDQWEKASPWTYNLDYITSDSVHIPISSIDLEDTTMFDLRYCNWPKDYFMGMLPSSQYGEEAFVPLGGGVSGDVIFDSFSTDSNVVDPAMVHYAINKSGGSSPVGAGLINQSTWYDGTPRTDSNINLVSEGRSSVVKDSSSLADTNPGIILDDRALWNNLVSRGISAHVNGSSAASRLSVLALRQAEALQKWKEIAQSGKQDYRTQIQKHFNVTPSEAMADHCRYVGGWSTNLDINEVVNTNLASAGDSADIYGKGVATGQGGCSFEAKEHGVLMCIYHNMPLLDWDSFGCKRYNLKSFFTDYAIPEFDSIGMQQVFQYELMSPTSKKEGETELQLGFVPRYADYKTAYDEIHGAFHDSLVSWVAPLTSTWWSTYLVNVIKRYGSAQLAYEFFKVNPVILDNLFGVNADSSLGTDQFLVNSFFDVKVVRNLDYNGLPY